QWRGYEEPLAVGRNAGLYVGACIHEQDCSHRNDGAGPVKDLDGDHSGILLGENPGAQQEKKRAAKMNVHHFLRFILLLTWSRVLQLGRAIRQPAPQFLHRRTLVRPELAIPIHLAVDGESVSPGCARLPLMPERGFGVTYPTFRPRQVGPELRMLRIA